MGNGNGETRGRLGAGKGNGPEGVRRKGREERERRGRLREDKGLGGGVKERGDDMVGERERKRPGGIRRERMT